MPDKPFDPMAGITNVPYERAIVDFIDNLIQIANKNGSKMTVHGEKDWDTIDYMYKGWKILYPQSSKEFEDGMKTWRAMSTALGVSREKGGAAIQHKLNLPNAFHAMMKIIFPFQRWDKKFTEKFAKRYGQFKGTDKY